MIPGAAGATEPAVAGPPTVEELVEQPVIHGASLSPDGFKLAVVREDRRDGVRNAYLLLFDTARLDLPPTPVVLGDYDVGSVSWANDERLLVRVLLRKTATGEEAGYWRYGYFFPLVTRRVLSISLDGREQVMLFGNMAKAIQNNLDLGTIIDEMPNDGRHVLMQIYDQAIGRQALYKVDIYTGQAVLVEKGDSETDGWITQDGVAILRLDSNYSNISVMARAPGETEWRFYKKFRRNQLRKLDGFDVVGTDQEPGVVLVSGRGETDPFRTIRRFDVRTLEMGDIVSRVPNFDVESCLTDRKDRLVATAFIDDRLNYVFTDPDLGAHYKGLNSYFRNECNVSIRSLSNDQRRMIVRASGPQHPGSYWLYDRTAKKLDPIGPTHPKLTRGRLAAMQVVHLKARDGLALTAYLSTPPASTGPRPLIVMPHGGPEARDDYGFDPLVQAMAAQGWLVLQVNFRGSDGYGRAFAEGGQKHWGDLMQNDVEDALAAVIARGGVDESRIAICGISYGGYAALMGAVKTPTRYRAVVAIAGDADLLESLAFTRRYEGSFSPSYLYWKSVMGDPSADRNLLLNASPARRAKEIQAPVLLMHGELDGIVSAEQSKIMFAALKNAKKSVDYVEVPKEGHPAWKHDNNIMMIKRSVAHIKAAFDKA